MFIYDKDDNIVPDPKMMFIPEFKRIWERDRSKNKKRAKKEFAYIYFIGDYKSEYNSYGLEKEERTATDIMGDEKYTPDELVIEAIGKYEKLQLTYSMRYLISVRKTVDSLIAYHDKLRFNPDDEKEQKNYDPSVVTRSLKDIESIVEKLEKWEKKVFDEEETMTIRGGGKAGIFEDKEKAVWLKNN